MNVEIHNMHLMMSDNIEEFGIKRSINRKLNMYNVLIVYKQILELF